jgi:hypothetical protein
MPDGKHHCVTSAVASHPGREAKRYQVEAVREFLRLLEIQP